MTIDDLPMYENDSKLSTYDTKINNVIYFLDIRLHNIVNE